MALHKEAVHEVRIEQIHGAGGYAASANACAYRFMEHKAEWCCIVDNDTAPQFDILRMLDDVPEEVDILAPVVYMHQDNRRTPMAGYYENDGNTFRPIDLTRPADLYEVDRCGGGCWFIRYRAFIGMKRPYFRTMYDDISQTMTVSDDCYFQANAKTLGRRIFCDTRYRAGHYHTMDISGV